MKKLVGALVCVVAFLSATESGAQQTGLSTLPQRGFVAGNAGVSATRPAMAQGVNTVAGTQAQVANPASGVARGISGMPARVVNTPAASSPVVVNQPGYFNGSQVVGSQVVSSNGAYVVDGYNHINPVTYYGAPWSSGEMSTYPVNAPVYGSTNLPGGFTYSYYGSWSGEPRVYQSYGPSDPFPYYGQPYGHAYDRYSWAAMSGENRLARYFYPPVP